MISSRYYNPKILLNKVNTNKILPTNSLKTLKRGETNDRKCSHTPRKSKANRGI